MGMTRICGYKNLFAHILSMALPALPSHRYDFWSDLSGYMVAMCSYCIVHANQQPVTFIFIVDPSLFT